MMNQANPAANPINVLFAHPSYPSQFSDVAEHLQARPDVNCYGLVSQPLVPRSGTSVPYFGFIPDGETNGHSYGSLQAFEAGMRNARGAIHALLELQQQMHVDVVVGYSGFGMGLFFKSLLNCALVAYSELPGYQSVAARQEFPFILEQALSSWSYEALNTSILLHADVGVVPSQHTRMLFPPELRDKIRVQMEGFDVYHLDRARAAVRAELGWSADALIVGFFGRTLEAVRGFDAFLHVVRELHAVDPAIQFVVIGEEKTIYGNETLYLNGQSFRDYALDQAGLPADLIHWYPPLPYDDFRRHIACLDLAILPYFEGAANWSLFDAMAVGLPIIAADRGYVAEAIRSGVDGILLDPYDVAGMTDRALTLLHDQPLATRLGESARARIRHCYSKEVAAAGYYAIIQEALTRYSSTAATRWLRLS